MSDDKHAEHSIFLISRSILEWSDSLTSTLFAMTQTVISIDSRETCDM
jgi:hypothetical protein